MDCIALEVLATCPELEFLDLHQARNVDWASQIPVIKAISQHPSSKLRLIYPQTFGSSDPKLDLSELSLSRVIFQDHDASSNHHDFIEKLVRQHGLHIMYIVSAEGDWYRTTYPGLRGVNSWSGTSLNSPDEFCDFLLRHPLLT
ncbi:hypothetical protein VKT23_011562 [Stygiomarasmius scandens]|uniref:Uncharacterized protein n=1 Tax=Marasmiellus scandens TaxID=2682957 RepID=A0ABR1JB73_9AGAR